MNIQSQHVSFLPDLERLEIGHLPELQVSRSGISPFHPAEGQNLRETIEAQVVALATINYASDPSDLCLSMLQLICPGLPPMSDNG